MPYTLTMGLLWVVSAVLLGIVIGWLMRSVVAKRQVERARTNHVDHVELDRSRARVAELEAEIARRVALDQARAADEAETPPAPDRGAVGERTTPSGSPNGAAIDPTASAVLGREVVHDDLTVVEGIGPTVAELCAGIGVTTWRDLATTEVSLLRTMLHDAGPRFRAHDPSSWPRQAGLLADGHWEEFRVLTASLGDAPPDESERSAGVADDGAAR